MKTELINRMILVKFLQSGLTSLYDVPFMSGKSIENLSRNEYACNVLGFDKLSVPEVQEDLTSYEKYLYRTYKDLGYNFLNTLEMNKIKSLLNRLGETLVNDYNPTPYLDDEDFENLMKTAGLYKYAVTNFAEATKEPLQKVINIFAFNTIFNKEIPENYIDTSSFSVMIKSKPIPKKFLLRFIENSVKTGIFYKELIPVDMLKFSIVSNKDFDSIYSENLLKYPQIIYEMDLWGRLTNKSVIRLLDNKLGTQTKAVINREKKILIKGNKKDVEIFHYLYKINIEETLVQTYLDDFYHLIYKISDYSDKPILYYINDSGIEYPYFNKLFGMSAYPKDDCFENLTKLNVISI